MVKRQDPPAGRHDLPSPTPTDDLGEAIVVDALAPEGDIARVAPWHDANADAGATEEHEAPARLLFDDIDAGSQDATAPDALSPLPAVADSQQLDLPLDDDATPGSIPDIRTEPGEMPSFVREAERAARWRQPRVRAALMLACLAAGLALTGQWMLAQRDLVAARSPGLRPMLEAACGLLGCRIEAPRALEALRVESSGLARVERSELYRLSVALRNLRAHEVALPALELALTDTQGQLIARRVLSAAELGARVAVLGAGAELSLQSTLQVSGSGAVAGYTIELFYP